MENLPDVEDDRKNMKHMIEFMLDVPKENIFEVQEATYEQLDEV